MASDKTKTQEATESVGFVAMIDAKIAALQKLRASFIDAASLGAMADAADMAAGVLSAGITGGFSPMGNGLGVGPMDLPTGVLLGKSLPAAIKLYLGAIKKKQTASEIAAALKEGGVESTAANFLNNVTSSLHRLKIAGDVLQFKDGWALAEFYPESLRNRIAKDAEPKKRAKGRKVAKKTAAKKAEAKAQKRKEPGQPGLEQRVSNYLQTRGSEYTSVPELATQLNVAAPVLNLTLGKMAKAAKIEKNDGRVRLTKRAA